MKETLTKERESARETMQGQSTMNYLVVLLAVAVAAFFVYQQFGAKINDFVKSLASNL